MQPSALAAGVYFGRPERRRSVGSLVLARTTYAPGLEIPSLLIWSADYGPRPGE